MPFSHLRDEKSNGVYFRTVANYTYDWESWHDPQGEIVWINDSVRRMTGCCVTECLAMPEYPLPIVEPEDRPQMRKILSDVIVKKSPMTS
ncbi:PAS domain-containing protein [Planctomycetaceae bacterium SH139]